MDSGVIALKHRLCSPLKNFPQPPVSKRRMSKLAGTNDLASVYCFLVSFISTSFTPSIGCISNCFPRHTVYSCLSLSPQLGITVGILFIPQNLAVRVLFLEGLHSHPKEFIRELTYHVVCSFCQGARIPVSS